MNELANFLLPTNINLYSKVRDDSFTGKDRHLGSYAVRVDNMQEGYRRAYLQDYSGRLLKPASLFLRIEKKYKTS